MTICPVCGPYTAMKIPKIDITSLERESRIEDLRLLLEQPTCQEMRPCRFCTLICKTLRVREMHVQLFSGM
ncbi:hypothetical protein IH879_04045 [candidate division KSB1 bacterium]|nr:hypothetical protein [candidate division KSB1 bacterium]